MSRKCTSSPAHRVLAPQSCKCGYRRTNTSASVMRVLPLHNHTSLYADKPPWPSTHSWVPHERISPARLYRTQGHRRLHACAIQGHKHTDAFMFAPCKATSMSSHLRLSQTTRVSLRPRPYKAAGALSCLRLSQGTLNHTCVY